MLELGFSVRGGRVLVACDPAYASHLQAMRARYATASSINNQSFDVELEDFLLNLRELAGWPDSDAEIRWNPELLGLVERNASDADSMAEALRTVSPASATPDVAPMPWPMPLTSFQVRDCTKLLSLNHGANFSVPGAGKTRVALALFRARWLEHRSAKLLVVCPKSALEAWLTEIPICFPGAGLKVAIMDTSIPPSGDVVLVNYERLPESLYSLVSWLRAQATMLVLDEAHRMKLGPAGAWGSACITLAPHAAHRLILTGTPAPNGPKDLENLFAFVWPGQGRAAVAAALSGGDLRAASAALRPLFVRTTKNELQLPPVDLSVRRVGLPPLHRELYNALVGEITGALRFNDASIADLGKVVLYLIMAATTPALLATGASRHEPLAYRLPPLQPPPGSSLAELMRDLPQYELSPKYQEALAIVAANAAMGRKTIVWSTFVRSLTSLAVLLGRFHPALVYGATEDRAAELARFRDDPECLVLLSNPATLGEGMNLHQECHDAVYVDRDFAAGRFLQSLDRIHRLGLPPETTTRITVLVADKTIDDVIEQRLAAKLRFMGGVLDDPAVLQLGDLDEEPSVGAGMDNADIAALVSYLSADASA